MPNWYSGQVTIIGDVTPFSEWYARTKETPNELSNFAATFAPLSTGKYNFGAAVDEWGVKWDLNNTQIVSISEDRFSFTFDTPWNAPIYLWKQLETKYGVIINEVGYEEQQLEFCNYYKGRYIQKVMDADWFVENLNFNPSGAATKNDELMEEEKEEFKNDNWCDGMDKMFNNLSYDDPEWEDVCVTDSFAGQ